MDTIEFSSCRPQIYNQRYLDMTCRTTIKKMAELTTYPTRLIELSQEKGIWVSDQGTIVYAQNHAPSQE